VSHNNDIEFLFSLIGKVDSENLLIDILSDVKNILITSKKIKSITDPKVGEAKVKELFHTYSLRLKRLKECDHIKGLSESVESLRNTELDAVKLIQVTTDYHFITLFYYGDEIVCCYYRVK